MNGDLNGHLRPGWTAAKVRDVVEDCQPGFASGQKDVAGGVRHLRMNNIGVRGEMVMDLVRRVPDSLVRPHHVLRPGDVLVCTTNSGKLVGKSTLFNLPGKYAFSNHLTRLRPRHEIVDSSFLRWNLWLQWQRGAFDDRCKHWVNQSSLPRKALLETDILLPPLAEQHRIVATLEALIAKVNTNRQRLDHVQRVLERFRQSVLAAACSGQLTSDWRESVGPVEAPLPTPPKTIAGKRRRGANLSGPTELLIDEMPDIPSSWRYVRQDWPTKLRLKPTSEHR